MSASEYYRRKLQEAEAKEKRDQEAGAGAAWAILFFILISPGVAAMSIVAVYLEFLFDIHLSSAALWWSSIAISASIVGVKLLQKKFSMSEYFVYCLWCMLAIAIACIGGFEPMRAIVSTMLGGAETVELFQ